jgi:3-dehydroquinate synthase
MEKRIVLVGLSGAGKSTVGAMLAEALGWKLIDTDAEVERAEQRTVPEIFEHSGEAAFREIERRVLIEALQRSAVVIATGGGAAINDDTWSEEALGHVDNLTVWLDAPPDVLFQRLLDQQTRIEGGAVRPLLQGDDPLIRLTEMRRDRAPYYRRAGLAIPVGSMEVNDIVHLLAEAVDQAGVRQIQLDLPGGTSRIQIGNGVSDQLASVISSRWPGARTVWVISDEQVAEHHLEPVVHGLESAGIIARPVTFPAGEASKSLAGLGLIYDALLGGGVERADVVVALGGGVTGDLVGLAAATVLRGVGLVQMPTSLLAMVDSSVGGKTGINHPLGKNLIGAFFQPPEVVIDPRYLVTLPEREYLAGWAEIIKHGLIEPSTPAGKSGLLELIEANVTSLRDRSSPLLPGIIRRNVEIKASVVDADERETGLRAILNFGHTIGHAVEAAGYKLLHGEAVAVGLHGAMRLGVELDRVDVSEADRMRDLLSAFGLPVSVSADADEIRTYMRQDKKRVAGELHWVLPVRHGGAIIERGVPQEAVDSALGMVASGGSR